MLHFLLLPAFAGLALWQDGRTLIERGEWDAARNKFNEWKLEEPRAESSPEFHQNLAFIAWNSQNPKETVDHLVQAAQLSHTPFGSLTYFNLLKQLQNSLGVSESPLDQLTVFCKFAFGPNWTSFWITLLAILLVGGGSLYLHSENRMRRILKGASPALIIPVLFLAPALVNRFAPATAVVASAHAKIWPTQEPENTATPLIELYEGTIVALAKGPSADRVEVTSPVAGWIDANEIQPLPGF